MIHHVRFEFTELHWLACRTGYSCAGRLWLQNIFEISGDTESYKANTYTKFIVSSIDYKGLISDNIKLRILEENTDFRDDLFPDFIILGPNIEDDPIVLLENGECMILGMFEAYLQTLI